MDQIKLELLCGLLKCSEYSLSFLLKEIDNFEVCPDDICDIIHVNGFEMFDINSVYNALYEIAIYNAVDRLETVDANHHYTLSTIIKNNSNIWTNDNDSCLEIADKGGTHHKMEDFDSMVEFLNANYLEVE